MPIQRKIYNQTKKVVNTTEEIERQPNISELHYFRNNLTVGGMATEDSKVIINPFSTLSDDEKNSVRINETVRIKLRKRPIKNFPITPEQTESFKTYGSKQNIIDTIIGRIVSGDPSAGKITDEQRKIVQKFKTEHKMDKK